METIIEERPTIGAHYLNADGMQVEMHAIGPTHVVVRTLGYQAQRMRIFTREEFAESFIPAPSSQVQQLELFAGE